MTNVYTTRLEEPEMAVVYDDALRWTIPSRTNPHETYLVELNDDPGYDVCQCKWFVTTLGPLLARGVSPEEAVASGLVKLKKGDRIEDALKCFHVKEAEYRFMRSCKRAMSNARRAADTKVRTDRYARMH